jgi:hypothetical protein
MDLEQRLRAGLGSKVMSWGKKIRGWFHFSKVGSGHSEAIQLRGLQSLILPEHTRYEGYWWERTFHLDGYYQGPRVDQATAFECAEAYHQETVMSSMKRFRRFFETSIEKSTRAEGYVHQFLEKVMTREGRDLVLQKLRRVFGKSANVFSLFGIRSQDQRKAQATKCVMGFTRKRGLFLPHWADDDRLWTPG